MTDFGDTDVPKGFWSLFMEKLKEEDAKWSPVTERRMYPFLVSYIHSREIESIFARGQERGLFKMETRLSHHQGPKVPPSGHRVFILAGTT